MVLKQALSQNLFIFLWFYGAWPRHLSVFIRLIHFSRSAGLVWLKVLVWFQCFCFMIHGCLSLWIWIFMCMWMKWSSKPRRMSLTAGQSDGKQHIFRSRSCLLFHKTWENIIMRVWGLFNNWEKLISFFQSLFILALRVWCFRLSWMWFWWLVHTVKTVSKHSVSHFRISETSRTVSLFSGVTFVSFLIKQLFQESWLVWSAALLNISPSHFYMFSKSKTLNEISLISWVCFSARNDFSKL